jgi:hypothetical protein
MAEERTPIADYGSGLYFPNTSNQFRQGDNNSLIYDKGTINLSNNLNILNSAIILKGVSGTIQGTLNVNGVGDAWLTTINNGSYASISTAPNNYACLYSVSTTKAWLPPRMTTAQGLTLSGAATGFSGAIVYDLTLNKLKVYNGAAWEAITSVASP